MKKISIYCICMVDSIHTARWLNQFQNTNFMILLVPSHKFRRVHPQIIRLIHEAENIKFVSPYNYFPVRFLGIIDYLLFGIYTKRVQLYLRSRLLVINLFLRINYKVHALELINAGHIAALTKKIHKSMFLIITNWGSELYYYTRIENETVKLTWILSKANLYSAECYRDYELALNLGYTGKFLPCIPNGGGFSELKNRNLTKKDLILVKGYGGKFGKVLHLLPILEKILNTYLNIDIYIYSVTKDVEDKISMLQSTFRNRLFYFTIKESLEHKKLLEIFSQAKIYIGASISDGISTSFLEALYYGAYPIQTNTSCANEWIMKGYKGSVVSLELIENEVFKILNNPKRLTKSIQHNMKMAKKDLSFDYIRQIALKFYGN